MRHQSGARLLLLTARPLEWALRGVPDIPRKSRHQVDDRQRLVKVLLLEGLLGAGWFGSPCDLVLLSIEHQHENRGHGSSALFK